MKIIYNPKNGSEIRDYWLGHKKWNILKNSLVRVEDDLIARHFMDTFGFLREVKVEELATIRKEMEAKDFVCEHCKKEFATEQQLRGHLLGQHKLTAEQEQALDGIPVLAALDAATPLQQHRQLTGDEAEGIPTKGKDQDGVEWYGAGVESDHLTREERMTKFVIPGKTPGVFGTAGDQ